MLYLIILLMTLVGAIASAFLKKASSNFSLTTLIKKISLFIGLLLYGMAALMNIYVLHYMEYSKVLPFTSLTYIWTLFLSYYFFHEKIGIMKLMGVFLIIVGVFLIIV